MYITRGTFTYPFSIMSRFRVSLSYKGTEYAGWQIQPNATTIQGLIEEALSTFYRKRIEIVGCGRTDAGVHASRYEAHFDAEVKAQQKDVKGINALLPCDIAISRLEQTDDDFHARFSCRGRSYEYHLHYYKDPFHDDLSFQFFEFQKVNTALLSESARLILDYEAFLPFCKSHSGNDHYRCQMGESRWDWDEMSGKGVYRISANRFLRGMVRLLVGMQLNVALGKIALDDVKRALESQERLARDWSVPAKGLFLSDLKY